MNAVTQIYLTEGVSIVAFESAPANIDFIAELFKKVGAAGINVDMISQTAPKGSSNTISFTVRDDDVANVLGIINTMKSAYKSIFPFVSTGNVKISLYGEEMPKLAGVAADVLANLSKHSVDTLLITTSDVDISIVVSNDNADRTYELLKNVYLNK